MILYHGSNIPVKAPRLFKSDRRLDFGTGFYLTSNLEQACKWAQTVTKRSDTGCALVSVFNFDDSASKNLNISQFEEPNIEWLKFVSANRNAEEQGNFDIVIGPVANDRTVATLCLFFAGIYSEEETIKRLLPQNLHDQYVFKTQAAIELLQFSKVVDA